MIVLRSRPGSDGGVATNVAWQVYDLKTLRQLAEFSLRLDPAAFLAYLEALRASEGTRSVWLFLPAAHVLFENAKRRVFKLVRVRIWFSVYVVIP
jgi:hypothetical protein